MPAIMEQPFPKSTSAAERCRRLFEVVSIEDTVAVLIDADPDAMASALALKRLFWRKVRKTVIFHINAIQRADNLSFIRLLNVRQHPMRDLDAAGFTKWAIVDSQPHHHEQLGKYRFDIIIDHHPLRHPSPALLVDIREGYGAASTILVEYLRAAGIRPSARLATALFYGIKTDTDNFARPTTPNDINAFRYLYPFTNIGIIKKIESSEMTKETLADFRTALGNLILVKDRAFIHMGRVSNPDTLVIMADFFLKMAEATWCIVSGVCGQKLVVIFRHAGFRLDAGKTAQRLFGQWGAAGGHKSAARAEMPLQAIEPELRNGMDPGDFVLGRIRRM